MLEQFMPQVFQPPLVLGIKLALGAALVALVSLWVLVYEVLPAYGGLSSPRQPIPFSHQHHVGDDGIDCRYCHTSVERSSFAGIPATDVCMTCHSQLFTDAPVLAPLREAARSGRPIHWVRVHDLPDFVYFNHSIHLAKGIGCIECHGRVDQMPRIRRVASLEMQWCLGCHRNPGPHLREPARVFEMTPTPGLAPSAQAALMARLHIADTRRLTDCSTCHR
jgi:hypothetical protein